MFPVKTKERLNQRLKTLRAVGAPGIHARGAAARRLGRLGTGPEARTSEPHNLPVGRHNNQLLSPTSSDSGPRHHMES